MRPTVTEHFMAMARLTSERATCASRKVGAVLVAPGTHHVIATGYNGVPSGQMHCTAVGCVRPPGDPSGCLKSVHAEANIVAQAALSGRTTFGSTLYATCRPCWRCAGLLASAGVREVFYAEDKGEADAELLAYLCSLFLVVKVTP